MIVLQGSNFGNPWLLVSFHTCTTSTCGLGADLDGRAYSRIGTAWQGLGENVWRSASEASALFKIILDFMSFPTR